MNITAYEYLSILQAMEVEQTQENDGYEYIKLLKNVRSVIAEKHSRKLSSTLGNAATAQTLKTLIHKYCVEALAEKEFDREKLAEKIYQDMAGLGVLTDYFYDPNVDIDVEFLTPIISSIPLILLQSEPL